MKQKPIENKITLCIGYCVYDYDYNLCMGCGRTLEDISAWFNLKDEEKKNAMQHAKKRLAQFHEKK
tara:strand:- start:1129 stop:1326 length:198 start_codon:yes stop_codon:yes gene_type:complete